MIAHEIDYRIIGDDIQLVEAELDPGETVIAEAGSMMYMDNEISYDTRMGDDSKPDQGLFNKLVQALSPYGHNARKEGRGLLNSFLER